MMHPSRIIQTRFISLPTHGHAAASPQTQLPSSLARKLLPRAPAVYRIPSSGGQVPRTRTSPFLLLALEDCIKFLMGLIEARANDPQDPSGTQLRATPSVLALYRDLERHRLVDNDEDDARLALLDLADDTADAETLDFEDLVAQENLLDMSVEKIFEITRDARTSESAPAWTFVAAPESMTPASVAADTRRKQATTRPASSARAPRLHAMTNQPSTRANALRDDANRLRGDPWRVRISSEVLAVAYFLRFDAKLSVIMIAAILRLNYDTAKGALLRETRRRDDPLWVEPEANESEPTSEEVAMSMKVRRLYGFINEEHYVTLFGNNTTLEMLRYPGDRRSACNVHWTIELIRSARSSLDISMYSFTLCKYAQEILAIHRRPGTTVRVLVDTTQMASNGIQVKKLVEAGVPVYINNISSFMTHEKFMIIDRRSILEGSVNFTGKALILSGKMFIMNAMRAVLPLIQDFEIALSTARRVTHDEVTRFYRCPCAART